MPPAVWVRSVGSLSARSARTSHVEEADGAGTISTVAVAHIRRPRCPKQPPVCCRHARSQSAGRRHPMSPGVRASRWTALSHTASALIRCPVSTVPCGATSDGGPPISFACKGDTRLRQVSSADRSWHIHGTSAAARQRSHPSAQHSRSAVTVRQGSSGSAQNTIALLRPGVRFPAPPPVWPGRWQFCRAACVAST
jgi:hypothetical protein